MYADVRLPPPPPGTSAPAQKLCASDGYSFLRLDGNTANDQRPRMIKRFAEESAIDSNVFLISTRAGGTGLNLQSANKVILYDVNWVSARDVSMLLSPCPSPPPSPRSFLTTLPCEVFCEDGCS